MLILLWCLLFVRIVANKLPIVYVYTVVPAVCKYGLPDYIRKSLEQALLTQPDCDVIMASNYIDCPLIRQTVENIPKLIHVDLTEIASPKTLLFRNLSEGIFQTDNFGELWITSALRFFNMEDIMISRGYSEMIHVEADNLLYGRLTSLLPVLRSSYRGLAATPLNSNKSFITASVLWISSLSSLQAFNGYLSDLSSNQTSYKNYLKWLRVFACCKPGGVDQDSRGMGIKPFAINEMSMLAYYHELFPQEFQLFPVVPQHNYVLNRYVCNMSQFAPEGEEVGAPTLNGIWDPNSWGQLVGGTHHRKGKDKGFTDPTHIAGQAIRTSKCWLSFICSNQTNKDYQYSLNEKLPYYVVNHNSSMECLTAPFIRCNVNSSWTPLWNLHVHSKQTVLYVSQPCSCGSTEQFINSPNFQI